MIQPNTKVIVDIRGIHYSGVIEFIQKTIFDDPTIPTMMFKGRNLRTWIFQKNIIKVID
jgi:hypothetical protein